MLMGQLRGPDLGSLARGPQKLLGVLPDGICKVLSRHHVPLLVSEHLDYLLFFQPLPALVL